MVAAWGISSELHHKKVMRESVVVCRRFLLRLLAARLWPD